MAEKLALQQVSDSLVLDRSEFVGLSAMDMHSVITNIRGDSRKLFVVDSAEDFFSVKTLFKYVDDYTHQGLEMARLVNEHTHFFNDAQMNMLVKIVEAKIAPPNPPEEPHVKYYHFEETPPGWSISYNMSIGPTKIRRKVPSVNGDGTLFWMNPSEYEKLWLFASALWADDDPEDVALMPEIETGLGPKTVCVSFSSIDVGGNTIRRYEIEQVARHRGWNFPLPIKV